MSSPKSPTTPKELTVKELEKKYGSANKVTAIAARPPSAAAHSPNQASVRAPSERFPFLAFTGLGVGRADAEPAEGVARQVRHRHQV